jgi:SAM-dependent methyltransferase
MYSHISFGYPWYLSYGHLALLLVTLPVLWIVWKLRWPRILLYAGGLFAFWCLTSFFIARFVLDINGRGTLPTQAFLPNGPARVLDLGAGTGRSTLMVLEARPQATVVALDLFGESYDEHFGKPLRLSDNLRLAGVADRATIQKADMRQIPFEANSFDGVISAYAIDHLDRAGIRSTLSETARVVKPGGQFLMMVVGKEFWIQYAFGPLLVHARRIGSTFWADSLTAAGFDVVEQGHRPGTLYILARKR